MLADIVERLIGRQIALDVVARLNKRDALREKLTEIGPDLVLVGLRSHESDQLGISLLKFLPMAKVIAFSNDARQAWLYEMRAHRAAIIDVSARALIEAIHSPD